MAFALLGTVVVGIVFGLVASSRWAGERGWFYNKHNPRPPGVGLQPGTFDEIYQPSIRHVMEEEESQRVRTDQDASGDDPR